MHNEPLLFRICCLLLVLDSVEHCWRAARLMVANVNMKLPYNKHALFCEICVSLVQLQGLCYVPEVHGSVLCLWLRYLESCLFH